MVIGYQNIRQKGIQKYTLSFNIKFFKFRLCTHISNTNLERLFKSVLKVTNLFIESG